MTSQTWPPFNYENHYREDYAQNFKLVGKDVAFSIPPKIADLPIPPISKDVLELTQEATAIMPRHSEHETADIGGITEGLLLRAEAINSSRIEGNMTSIRNLSLAVAGATSKSGARTTVKNVECLEQILKNPSHKISRASLLADHSEIMSGKAKAAPGRFRRGDEEVYVSNFAAPLPSKVEELIRDWVRFANRTGIDIIQHIAIAHSQFESIHPFCDGNGRTGRAATQRMLLRTNYRTLPVSAALLAIREHYYDTFTAYQKGELEYPIHIHAVAFWAAAKSLNEYIPDHKFIFSKWCELSDANDRQKANTKKALNWISKNPAFTQDILAKEIGISSKTSIRIIERLAELEIVKPGRKTHKSENGYTKQIWEAHEIYDLVESVEKSVANRAQQVAPSRYSVTDFSHPLPPEGKEVKKNEIKNAIKETGSHSILALPTADNYSFGISLFELFILKDGQIKSRHPLDECKIYFSDMNGKHKKLQINISFNQNNSFSATEYNAKVPNNKQDISAFNFAKAVNDRSWRNRISNIWESFLVEFETTLRIFHMWKKVAVWSEYPGPNIIELPVFEEYQRTLGNNIGRTLFISLNEFLRGSNGRGNELKFSLSALIKKTKQFQGESLPECYDVKYPFTSEQIKVLESVEKDIKKFGKAHQFWEQINDDNLTNQQKQNLIIELIAKQSSEQRIATYLRTARNCMAHNSKMSNLEKFYLINVGYNDAEEYLTEIAINETFKFLSRIHTEVFGLDKQSLLNRKNKAELEAVRDAEKLWLALHESSVARSYIKELEKNRSFRANLNFPVNQHKCELPIDFETLFLEKQPMAYPCYICGGMMHVLHLDEEIKMEVFLYDSKSSSFEELNELVMVEGVYGHTSIQAKGFGGFLNEQAQNITPEDKAILKIILYGELLWEGECLIKLIWKTEPIGNSHVNLLCHTVELFSLPYRRYLEISERFGQNFER